jgi:serine/threonine protein kinase
MTQKLGRYPIVRPLKRGGMAELFLARGSGDKQVVLKRILPEMAGDAEYVAMFLEEARLAVALHHGNIVHAWEVGEEAGSPFFVMEFLDGEDVHALLRSCAAAGERVPLEHALGIAIGVAAGLHHAHELRDAAERPLGIVHRDVSPHNIAVTFDGGVKLLDFGVAKTRRKSATRVGTLKGKVGYMSPEQCRGDELDRRSDLFAFSVVLWELLAGRRLYGGKSDFGVMRSIVDVDAPPAGCAPELEAIVARGLQRDREARFATAEEIQLALEAFARDRRLAISGVGLGRFMRERFGARAVAQPSGERTTSLYSVPREDDGDATIVDGVVMPEPPRKGTRKVEARGVRWPAWAGAGIVAASIVTGGFLWSSRKTPPPTPPPPVIVQPQAPVVVEPPPVAPEPPPVVHHQPPVPKSVTHKRSHPPRKAPLDLDAPLPPK